MVIKFITVLAISSGGIPLSSDWGKYAKEFTIPSTKIIYAETNYVPEGKYHYCVIILENNTPALYALGKCKGLLK